MQKNIHHALLFEGFGEEGEKRVYEYIEKNITKYIKNNPDISYITVERFTIADVRTLKERSAQAPFGSLQIFIISTELILREAQNALLKLFEEPASQTYFILIIPSTHTLLDTIRSRMMLIKKTFTIESTHTIEKDFVTRLCNATPGERITLLEPIIKEKDRVQARIILNTLEQKLHQEGVRKNFNALREISFVRTYLSDTSSSLKMLLEHIAYML